MRAVFLTARFVEVVTTSGDDSEEYQVFDGEFLYHELCRWSSFASASEDAAEIGSATRILANALENCLTQKMTAKKARDYIDRLRMSRPERKYPEEGSEKMEEGEEQAKEE